MKLQFESNLSTKPLTRFGYPYSLSTFQLNKPERSPFRLWLFRC